MLPRTQGRENKGLARLAAAERARRAGSHRLFTAADMSPRILRNTLLAGHPRDDVSAMLGLITPRVLTVID
ncbi:hypothetical protein [Cupriavidus lacunae]|uniref:Uncharacterized protein n=1 Tax=Cupriavidus lacunae TaxID=2666307 RepID=A0A370NQU2_9BURK|nr:hypothetical protein [Cupriavidus lacunae]RDK07965.1 hypothetical protein DN412_22930 [Cupriavidus lacunae]